MPITPRGCATGPTAASVATAIATTTIKPAPFVWPSPCCRHQL
jgi:hypothetical protein